MSHIQAEALLLPLVENGVEIYSKSAEFMVDYGIRKMKELLNRAVGGYASFEDKIRPLVVMVANPTEGRYKLMNFGFDSGKPYKYPFLRSYLEPKTAMMFYFSNKDGSMFTGVSGYMWFLGANDQAHNSLAIGFSHPYIGSVKTEAHFLAGASDKSQPESQRETEVKNFAYQISNCMEGTNNPGVSREYIEALPFILVDLRYVDEKAAFNKC